jgi:serine/threonine protein kinase/tetratricopeptide (TPR) repeat protein
MAGKLQDIFEQVIGLEESQRDAYLADACRGDPALRAQVDALLRAHQGASRFMASPTAATEMPTLDTSGSAALPLREGPGARIGPYKILQLIGEGGFGSVFMAEQERPVQRRVALKIIKLGMDTRQVVARFEQERQALAMMDHPNIAKVLDAGATETGRPFFVMELVKGDPIAVYADKKNMSINERLALFAQVCNAVQHAHTKGIIHRDIKPSNVLVSTQDGRPHAKVIDFGIAKATQSKLTEKTLFTEHRHLIGTPEYMSPEQAEGSLDIDTRTDVYSLGVLLYELLTGTTPFTSKQLRAAAYDEIQRIIREVEPPTPSARLVANTESLASVAACRQIEPRRLDTLVRGELDWIVMKALEKDRKRRYETPSSLGLDIEHYLRGEPITAAPPSRRYRATKFFRRHRAGVIGGGVLGLSLVLGIVGTSIGMMRANRSAASERIALAAAEARRVEAEANLAFASQGNQILTSVFADLDPGMSYGSVPEFRAALRANLGEAVRQLDGTAIGDASQVVAMQRRLALSLLGLGDAARAAELLKRAGDTSEAQLGREHPQTLQIRSSLSNAYFEAGKLDIALPLIEETLTLRSKVLGPEHDEVIGDMQAAAVMNASARKSERATFLASEALKLRRATRAADGPAMIAALFSVAQVNDLNGSTDLAASAWQEVVSLMERTYGRSDTRTVVAIGNLANACQGLGWHEKAIQLYQEVLRNLRDRLGRDHPATLLAMGNLANAYMAVGKPDSALLLYEETFKLREIQLGPDHPQTIGALNHLAAAVWQAGREQEALRHWEDALARGRAKFGNDHVDVINGMLHLATKYSQAGNTDLAVPLFEEAAQRRSAVFGASHIGTVEAQVKFAEALVNRRSYAQAHTPLLRAYETLSALPPDGPQVRSMLKQTLDLLIKVAQAQGTLDEATKWRAERERRLGNP